MNIAEPPWTRPSDRHERLPANAEFGERGAAPSRDEPDQPVSPVDESALIRPVLTRPVLRVVRGDPAPEELAALTAILAAPSAGHAASAANLAAPTGGAAPFGAAALGANRLPASGAWAASARPRSRVPRVRPGAWAASGRGPG